jgi:acyl-CoA thioester hydrolase
MTLHVDMNVRRVAPFPPDIYARVQAVAAAHAKAPRPEGIGRRIAMPEKK